MNIIVKLASVYGPVKKQDIDISKCIEDLVKDGYSIPEEFTCFLNKYGGFYGFHAAYGEKKSWGKQFYINPQEAIKTIFIEKVKVYENITKCKLVPIGESDSKSIILMYGDGCIYGGFDDFLCKYGSNIKNSLEALIKGEEVECLAD